MLTRGILMAGGLGTRLAPATRVVNKHLLLVYDRPMIMHSLGTLLAIGVDRVLLIADPGSLKQLEGLLGDGSDFGIHLEYASQQTPGGIAEGLLVGAQFAVGHQIALALGDNLFMAPDLAKALKGDAMSKGARVYVKRVSDATGYGVLEMNEGLPISIEEKPEHPRSRMAVTGLYLFDGRAAQVAASISPSRRGELEITDVVRWYLDRNDLEVSVLSSSVHWADLGTFDGLLNASLRIRERNERRALVGNNGAPSNYPWRPR